MKSKNTLYSLICVTLLAPSCKQDASELPDTEIGKLYAELNDNSFAFYQNQDKILDGKGSSPHGEFRLRFNTEALAALDSTGKLPQGASFPDDAIVLKEVMKDGKVDLYVAMKKSSTNSNAASGWIWYGFEKNGKVKYDPADKGKGCVGCHSSTGHRDFTLSFDLH